MTIPFYKYQGAGNDFIILDGIAGVQEPPAEIIKKMCSRRFGIGADGLMLLLPSDKADFRMKYFNSDGLEGSLCGNGGRCIVRFAADQNIVQDECRFMAVDGEHRATIDENGVHLKMHSVKLPADIQTGIIETGSPHVVVPVTSVDEVDVPREGRKLRFAKAYEPSGTNVNFIEEVSVQKIRQRTYERGVEDETRACGTGAVAGAVFQAERRKLLQGVISVCMPGGKLNVTFARSGRRFVNLWLSGPAEYVFSGTIRFD